MVDDGRLEFRSLYKVLVDRWDKCNPLLLLSWMSIQMQ